MPTIDFEGLNARLSLQIRSLLPLWLPGGKIIGKEYAVGSILGGIGDSLRFNIEKCIGSDFATNEKFGDCIDLYAKIKNISQLESAKQLLEQFPAISNQQISKKSPEIIPKVTLPPEDSQPNLNHFKYGAPSLIHCYRNEKAQRIYYMCRYETPSGKQFFPWSYFDDNIWRMKSQDIPRPLYLLDELNSDKPCLIVEGEKCADAAKKFAGEIYNITTWSNGSQSFNKTDWRPLYGKQILIWPDADKSGISASLGISKILSPHCSQIKFIDVTENVPENFDAADSNFTWETFKEWAKPRIKIYNHSESVIIPTIEPKRVNRDITPDEPVIDGSLYAIWEKMGVACSANGQPICNLDNALRVLQGFPLFTDIIWFDEFHQKYYTLWQSSKPREWSDIEDFRLASFVQRELGLVRMSDEMINKAVRLHGKNNTRNEPKDWLNSLKWDQVPRISEFFNKAAGADLNEYVTAASQNFWLTMVARILHPGCQVDNMIVLEGIQGKGKTSLLRTIGGDWYASAKEKIDSNNFFLMLQGKLLIEIAELDSFNRSEITRIKQVVSDPVDRYRSPYDRATEDHPRQSVFVGTTNESTYLRDDSGARRFWPIKCSNFDLSYVDQYRTQLFAESAYLIKSEDHLKHQNRINSCWWKMPPSAIDEQEERRQIDPWEDSILEYSIQRFEVTTSEIMNNCLHIDKSKQSRFDEIRIGNILRKIQYSRTRKRIGGNLRWIYVCQDDKLSENIQ